MDKKLEYLKKYNYLTGYDEGRFIDAQDSVNTWCLSSICQIIDPKNIKVHYDGWSSKWDMVSTSFLLLDSHISNILMNLTISVRLQKSQVIKSRHSENGPAVTQASKELHSATT